jgi:hypothetical protein
MAHRFAGRLSWRTLSPLFWVLAALYVGHRLQAWQQVSRPDWLRFYLDDFLCLPLVLTVTLFLMRFLYGPQVRLSRYHVLFVVVYVAGVFEGFLPYFMPRYTQDLLDVGLYAAGGAVFYFFLNK